jgi:hypothetical protein
MVNIKIQGLDAEAVIMGQDIIIKIPFGSIQAAKDTFDTLNKE